MNKLKNKKSIVHIIFFILLVLIILLQVSNHTKYIFFIFSLITNLLLITLYIKIIKKEKVTYSKKEIIISLLVIISIYLFYIISFINRKFIYYMDYSCYYNIQIETIESFNKGIISGIFYFLNSTCYGEYGNFLSLFPQVLFQFTDKSINSYLISSVITYIPYIIMAYSILVKILLKKIKKYNEKNYIISNLLLITFPIFHASSIYGQPDYFGLVFVFLIIILTINYNFKKIDTERLSILLIITMMLTITRKWYMYWIVTYYPLYAITVLLENKKDSKIILKNMMLYLLIVIVVYISTMFPMIKNILKTNYTHMYKFYNRGNILNEIINQIKYIGIVPFILYFVGYINKNNKKYSFILLIQYLSIIFLFTRVEFFEKHHLLLLLPMYLYGLLMITTSNNKIIKYISVLIITINVVFGFTQNKNILFTSIELKVPNEGNYEVYGKIYKWLDNHIDENNKAYMINHSKRINSGKIRYFKTPNTNVHNNLPYGSAIVGVHKFPIELFEARYVINSSPFEEVSLDAKYNKVFNKLVKQKIFKKVKTFKLKDNTIIQIYERVENVTIEEKNMYINELRKESKEYKDLYDSVINSYTIE